MKLKKLLLALAAAFLLTGCMSNTNSASTDDNNQQQTPGKEDGGKEGEETKPDDPNGGEPGEEVDHGPITSAQWFAMFNYNNYLSFNSTQNIKQYDASGVLKTDALVKIADQKLQLSLTSGQQSMDYYVEVKEVDDIGLISGFQYVVNTNDEAYKIPFFKQSVSTYLSYAGVLLFPYDEFAYNSTLNQYECAQFEMQGVLFTNLVVKFTEAALLDSYSYSFATSGENATSGSGSCEFSNIGSTVITLPEVKEAQKIESIEHPQPTQGSTKDDDKDEILDILDHLNNYQVRCYSGAIYSDEESNNGRTINYQGSYVEEHILDVDGKNYKMTNINQSSDLYDADEYLKYEYGEEATKDQYMMYLSAGGHIGTDYHYYWGYDFDSDELTYYTEKNYETIVAYNQTDKQYIYYDLRSNGDVDSHYILDSELKNYSHNSKTELFINLIKYIVNNGEHDADKHSYTAEVNDKELFDLLPAAEYARSVTASFKNNVIDQIVFNFDKEVIEEEGGIDVSLFIQFSKIGEVRVTAPQVEMEPCEHLNYDYDALEDGHRKYCRNCRKYLGELESHDDDNEFHVCLDCFHRPEGGEKQYELPLFETDEYTCYGFTYRLDEYNNKVDVDAVVFVSKETGQEIYPSSVDDSQMVMTYSGDLYFPTAKALFRRWLSYDGVQIKADRCAKYYADRYLYYANIEGEVDETKTLIVDGVNFDRYALEHSLQPTRTMYNYRFYENHDAHEPTNTQIDSCHVKQEFECSVCHEIVYTQIVESHHYEYTQISRAEFLEHTHENGTYIEENALFFEATCSACHEKIWFYYHNGVLNPTHLYNDVYVTAYYVDENGNILTKDFRALIPHHYDDEGNCVYCGTHTEQFGELLIHYCQQDNYNYFYVTDLEGHELHLNVISSIEDSENNTRTLTYELLDDNDNVLATVIEVRDSIEGITISFSVTVGSGEPFSYTFPEMALPDNE